MFRIDKEHIRAIIEKMSISERTMLLEMLFEETFNSTIQYEFREVVSKYYDEFDGDF